jgi:subtilisin family serine protease
MIVPVNPKSPDEMPTKLPRGERYRVEQPLGREPVFDVPDDVLLRYNARVLDPASSVALPGQEIRRTVYIADRLLISGLATFRARDTITQAAAQFGLALEPPALPTELAAPRAELIEARRIPEQDVFHTRSHRLVRDGSKPDAPPADAWTVLQAFRSLSATKQDDGSLLRSEEEKHVSLDHLIATGVHTYGHPFVPRGSDSPYGGLPMNSYGTPGWGGRAPVAWLGARPHRDDDLDGRRPVVAVLDTGVGLHEWFDGRDIVIKNPFEGGVPIGLVDPYSEPELDGVVYDPLEGELDSDSGHGTFIAGLIHQLCPDANILSVRVMPSDGAVPEHVLLDALNLLVLRQRRAQAEAPQDAVDIVSLSLGYYHESVGDVSFDPLIKYPLDELARLGVIVVAAAGNDATMRPLFPAAFAPADGGVVQDAPEDQVPVVGVGALNPDQTVALFSNAGPWIKVYRTGAAVVSTFPQTFDASAQPAFRVFALDRWRETLDPDDFSCGFGTWSGTSFSTPVFAGELAKELLAGEHGAFDSVKAEDMLARGQRAVDKHTNPPGPKQ